MGRLNRSSCRSFIKVSSDRQRSGLSFLMKIDILPIFNLSAENRPSQVTTADFQDFNDKIDYRRVSLI